MNKLEIISNYVILHVVSWYGGFIRKRYYRKADKADRISKKLLLKLVHKNKNTVYGKKYNFKDIKSIKDYQDKVPFSLYEDYQEYINETAKNGSQNLITKDKIEFFAKTSGTTGVMKKIPVVKKSKKGFSNTVAMYINIIQTEMKKRGYKVGKGLNFIETESNKTPGGIREGLISAYTVKSGKWAVPIITCIPKTALECDEKSDMKYIKAFYALKDRNLTYLLAVFMSNITDLMVYIMENYELLINDIKNGEISRSVNIPKDIKIKLNKDLKPDVERANELKEIFENPKGKIIKRIWPRMSVIIGIGTGEFSVFARKLRDYCGEDVSFFNEIYGSSESLMASAMEVESNDYFLLYDNGFYEFIPVDEEDKRPLLLNELEVGKLYEIVITNLSGLYRYRIKDVVRVKGFVGQNPLVQFAYRKQQLINITGVKITSEHITNAIESFEQKAHIKVLDYCLYPNTNITPWGITLYIETKSKISPKLKENIGNIFDSELAKVNKEHGRMLKIGETSPTHVCITENNTFKRYREYRISEGASQNQIKSIRVINTKKQLDFFENSIRMICN